jgi:site-specific recombinase XerD
MALMEGTPPLVAPLPYESGLRIMETLRLRVQDSDFGMKAVAVRSGKGDNDRAACRLIRSWAHAVGHCCSPLLLAH